MLKYHPGRHIISTIFCTMALFLVQIPGFAVPRVDLPFLEHELGENLDQLESIIPILERDKAIKIAMPFFDKYPSFTEQLLGDAILYFPIIEKTLAKYNLPEDLKYIPMFESSFRVDAVSRMGAKGLWQFMPATAQKYGLTVNGEIDERLDYVKSTETAARYLRDLYEEFGDWALVLMAYNGGPYRIKRLIEQYNTTDAGVIMKHMPAESRTYLSKMVAAKLIFNSYEAYQLVPRLPLPEELYLTHEVYEGRIDLMEISKKHGISFNLLLAENPHLQRKVIQNSKHLPVNVRIPLFDNYKSSVVSFRLISLYLPDREALEALGKRINWDPRKILLYNGVYHQPIRKNHLYTIPVAEKDYLPIIKEFGPRPLKYLTYDPARNRHKVIEKKRMNFRFPFGHPETPRVYYLAPTETLVEVARKMKISLETLKELNPDLDLYQTSRIILPDTDRESVVIAK